MNKKGRANKKGVVLRYKKRYHHAPQPLHRHTAMQRIAVATVLLESWPALSARLRPTLLQSLVRPCDDFNHAVVGIVHAAADKVRSEQRLARCDDHQPLVLH